MRLFVLILVTVALAGCRGSDNWGLDADADVDADTDTECLPVELCFNCVDDDCDGEVDEFCRCRCTNDGVEIEDGVDNDCDGMIDERD